MDNPADVRMFDGRAYVEAIEYTLERAGRISTGVMLAEARAANADLQRRLDKAVEALQRIQKLARESGVEIGVKDQDVLLQFSWLSTIAEQAAALVNAEKSEGDRG